MKIALFGTETVTGRLILKQCVHSSILVHALTREELFLSDLESEYVSITKGSLFNNKDVCNSLKGCDHVIFTPPITDPEGNLTRSLGLKNILNCMSTEKISRIVCLSGYSICKDHDDKLWYTHKNYDGEDKSMALEYYKMLNMLQQSGFEYTIICAQYITEMPPTGVFKLSEKIDTIPLGKANGNDVAMAVINSLIRHENINKVVGFN